MKKTVVAVTVFLGLFCRIGMTEEVNGFIRHEMTGGKPSSTTVALFPEGGYQLWGFGLQSDERRWFMAGRTVPTSIDGLKAGGVVTFRPANGEVHLGATAFYAGEALGGKVCSDWTVYVPLNGGKWKLFSSETSLVWLVNDRISVGPAVAVLDIEGHHKAYRAGVKATAKVGDDATLTVRYLSPDELRLQLNGKISW